MTEQRIGIIDIGSNSVRLVIYERTPYGAHRVIDGSKRTARLSEQIDAAGQLQAQAIAALIDTLNHFRLICSHHRTFTIRAVATAAIRNAANRQDILDKLEQECGLAIEVLSGEQEAQFGFLGMANSLAIEDGCLIDIGGGSTEFSLFRNRRLIRSVSFPFGSVNLTRQFTEKGMLSDASYAALEAHVRKAVQQEPWIQELQGLPMVAVGGTARAFGKLHQAQHRYPFPQIHNYPISGEAADTLFQSLRSLPLDKRKKFPGLSKDRVDLIVPGLAVLRIMYRVCKAAHFLICGAGLRDGIFYNSRFTQQPLLSDVLAYSVNNLNALHPEAPQAHVGWVNTTALSLYDSLSGYSAFPQRARIWTAAASSLFRIGASIDYYHYTDHTFYLIVNSRLNGLSHREILIVASIASYKTKNRLKQRLQPYRELLVDSDLELIMRLGTLLQLSIALDRSETQPIKRLNAEIEHGKLQLQPLLAVGSLEVEIKEVNSLQEDFHKIWNLIPVLHQI